VAVTRGFCFVSPNVIQTLLNIFDCLQHRKAAKHVAMVTQCIELHAKMGTMLKSDIAASVGPVS
jgi:hypothetical protein